MDGTHEMVLAGYTESGAEEWHCPTCGRRTLLRWPPRYEKLVLDRGDEYVVHVGGKGGVRLGACDVTVEPSTAVADQEQQWLRDIGIDWDGASA